MATTRAGAGKAAAKAARPAYRCAECGWITAKWVGRCGECQAWGTVDLAGGDRAAGRTAPAAVTRPAVPIGEVRAEDAHAVTSGIPELDRVLGGGVVPGAVLLMAGEPGVGKSTLLLEAAARWARAGRRTLYVSGEESAAQVRLRAERTGAVVDELYLAAETDLGALLTHVEQVRPSLLIVDSVQTIGSAEVDGVPGGVTQVREVAAAVIGLAKSEGIATLLVGHVTKDGTVAGPRVLEHLVDVVLQFEGDRTRFFRTLRAAKNRFGSTNELGVFEMTGAGLAGVTDPSALFLGEGGPAAGAAVHIAVEGSRCFAVEVQALVHRTELAMPRRVAVGLDRNRLAMIVAVLGRHAHLPLSSNDVFVTIAGGIRIDEPAADLAVALAIASAERDAPLPPGVAAIGEISLTGELRTCSQCERRLVEAGRAGFARVVVPAADARRLGGTAAGAADLRGALGSVLGGAPSSRRDSGAGNDQWGV